MVSEAPSNRNRKQSSAPDADASAESRARALGAAAIAQLVGAGWSVAPATGAEPQSPSALAGASEELRTWTSLFAELTSADEAVWFLSRDDYAAAPDGAFAWNAFETMSLDSAATAEEAAAVVEFWRSHRPLLLSVRGEYSYLAERADGAIVHGAEPEFEVAEVIASNCAALLERLARGEVCAEDPLSRILFGGACAA